VFDDEPYGASILVILASVYITGTGCLSLVVAITGGLAINAYTSAYLIVAGVVLAMLGGWLLVNPYRHIGIGAVTIVVSASCFAAIVLGGAWGFLLAPVAGLFGGVWALVYKPRPWKPRPEQWPPALE